MNKFIKTLIIINGTIIPVVLLFVFFMLIKEIFVSGSYSDNDQQSGINIENKKLTEAGDTIVLQGINYGEPEQIYNSQFYCIEIEAKTYEEPEIISSSLNEVVVAEEDSPPPLRSYIKGSRLNYIFLDRDFNYIRKLVNKKASIFWASNYEFYNKEEESTIKNIVYLIAFSDTNKDGHLNHLDHHDLYISDLDGSNLTKITRNIDIVNNKFINHNSELFITYKDNSDKKEEYKLNKFAVYSIATKSLRFLTSVDKSVKEVVTILNKK